MAATRSLHLLRKSLQDRSAATVKRLAEATTRLLETRDFDSIAVDEIVAAAKASKGAFYFRFRTKADLLRYLAEDAFEAISSESSAFLKSAEARRLSLEAFVTEFIDVAARTYTTRRNLLRALLEQTRPGGDLVIAALVRAGSAESIRGLAAALERRKREMRCPDKDIAIATALVVLGVALRNSCLFPEQVSSVNGLTPARFRLELGRLVMAYLRPSRRG